MNNLIERIMYEKIMEVKYSFITIYPSFLIRDYCVDRLSL